MITDDTHYGVESQAPDVTFLTPRDVQQQLQIGERLCYKLLRSQAIPNVRVGNLYRSKVADLDQALSSGAALEVSK